MTSQIQHVDSLDWGICVENIPYTGGNVGATSVVFVRKLKHNLFVK